MISRVQAIASYSGPAISGMLMFTKGDIATVMSKVYYTLLYILYTYFSNGKPVTPTVSGNGGNPLLYVSLYDAPMFTVLQIRFLCQRCGTLNTQ